MQMFIIVDSNALNIKGGMKPPSSIRIHPGTMKGLVNVSMWNSHLVCAMCMLLLCASYRTSQDNPLISSQVLFLIMSFHLKGTFHSHVWWDMTESLWPLKASKLGCPHQQLQYWRHGMWTKYTIDSSDSKAFQPTSRIWILRNCPTSMKEQCKSTTRLTMQFFQWHRTSFQWRKSIA